MRYAAIDPATASHIEIDAKYAVYLDRQKRDVSAHLKDEALGLPSDLDYQTLRGLSNEVKLKLEAVRPATLGQAGRIDGMTPAAMTLLASRVRQRAQAGIGT